RPVFMRRRWVPLIETMILGDLPSTGRGTGKASWAFAGGRPPSNRPSSRPPRTERGTRFVRCILSPLQKDGAGAGHPPRNYPRRARERPGANRGTSVFPSAWALLSPRRPEFRRGTRASGEGPGQRDRAPWRRSLAHTRPRRLAGGAGGRRRVGGRRTVIRRLGGGRLRGRGGRPARSSRCGRPLRLRRTRPG